MLPVVRPLQKLVLALVVLALPVQGVMAATMPLCGHEAGAAQNQTQHDHGDATQAYAGSHEHAIDSRAPGLHCHDCALCQVCASPVLAGFVATMPDTVAALPYPAPPVRILAFFPELFQRPPLAIAA